MSGVRTPLTEQEQRLVTEFPKGSNLDSLTSAEKKLRANVLVKIYKWENGPQVAKVSAERYERKQEDIRAQQKEYADKPENKKAKSKRDAITILKPHKQEIRECKFCGKTSDKVGFGRRGFICNSCKNGRYRYDDLDASQQQALLESQNGLCKLCDIEIELRTGNKNPTSAVIDHDHDTGIVRGVICPPCNKQMGYVDATKKYVKKIGWKRIQEYIRNE